MWHQIAINKRNTYILLTAMLIIFLILGAAFGVFLEYYLDLTEITPEMSEQTLIFNAASNGIITALVIWTILLLTALLRGKETILSLNNAQKIPHGASRILENVVEEMSIAAGMPKPPEIFVIDALMPNAFATGLSPENSAIAVTTGLLTELDRDELQAVVAHEIAHIVNRDTMYMIFTGIMIGTITVLADFALRMMRGSSSRTRSSKSSGSGIILLIALVLMIISPIIAQILYFSISQRREYLADACAAQFTRYPQALASALAKISGSIHVYRDADKITSAMFIVHPLDTEERYKNNYSMFGNLFSTHPPTEKRIAVLSQMAGADFNAYNEAFKKVSGRRKPVLSKDELYGVKPLEIIKPEKENTNSNFVAGAVVTAGVATLADEKIQKTKEKLSRKRDAVDTLWKSNNYIFKQCECGTKMKFPQEYKGQKIQCPHCGNIIEVTEDDQ